jgi:hypothetical protein
MSEIHALWEEHRQAGWPAFSDPNQGELMTLDTVISGCVRYYLDTPEGLDSQRITMLEDCITDLDHLLPDLADEHATGYFVRLRRLAGLILDAHQLPS